MGLFDIDNMLSNAMDEMFGSVMKGAMAEYEENRKRPGIETLIFKSVPAKKAEEIKNVKTGLFGGGTKKSLRPRSRRAGRLTPRSLRWPDSTGP